MPAGSRSKRLDVPWVGGQYPIIVTCQQHNGGVNYVLAAGFTKQHARALAKVVVQRPNVNVSEYARQLSLTTTPPTPNLPDDTTVRPRSVAEQGLSLDSYQ